MHLLWRLLGRRSPWPQRFLGWCARALGVRVKVIGERVEGTALFAANHLSWMDILIVGGATGASFVSKDSVRNWPVAGRLATMVGTIYISAEDRRAAGAQAERIREALEDGTSVAFFPEGKIENGEFLPFRPALFGAITVSDKHFPVQPVALDFRPHEKRLVWRKGAHAGWHAWDLAGDPGVKDVTVQLLDPVFAAPEDHRKELAYKAEAAVAEALGRSPASELP